RHRSVLVGLRCSSALPGYEQNQVAGREYGVEYVPRRAVGGPRIQAEPLGAIVRVVGLPLLRESVPRGHLIVGGDLADAQVVVCEDFVAALPLDLLMAPADAPADERL